MIDVRVQAARIDPGQQIERLRTLGKAAVLAGVTIAEAADDVTATRIEHYPAMAKAELAGIARQAVARWPLDGLILIHRHGRVQPGDPVLFVAVASGDRRAAPAALDFLYREVAARAPFWRRDTLSGGGHRWAGAGKSS